MYTAIFARRADRDFSDLTDEQAQRVKQVIEALEVDPRSSGTIRLEAAPVGRYRRRVGSLRILFDIDDRNRVIKILAIRKRDERTYR